MRLAIIPARGGSKRISKKNIRKFAGKPLISWSIIKALEANIFDRLIVSTDDEEIAEISKSYGAEVPFIRPIELSDDHTKIRPVLRHALMWLSDHDFTADLVCCILPTAPFLDKNDLNLGLEKLIVNDDRIIVPITKYSSPIQRALTLDLDGTIKPVWQEKIKERSQDLEQTYFDSGQFYWASKKTFLEKSDDLLGEKSLGIVIPNERVEDIDTENDFMVAESKFLALQKEKNISKICIGTANFAQNYGISNEAGKLKNQEIGDIFNMMKAIGIKTVDTAPSYADAEKIIGNIGVDHFSIMSKLPSIPKDIKDINSWVQNQIETILDDLSVESIYSIFFHDPSQLIDNDFGKDAYKHLIALKEKGLIQKIGASIYDPSILNQLTKGFDLDIIQAPLNIFDRRISDSGWLKKLKKQNIEVVTRSIFLQGLLLMEPKERPIAFNKWKNNFDLYDEWLIENSISRLEACLRHQFSYSEIDKIIIGIDSSYQLFEISNFFKHGHLDCPNELSSDDKHLIDPNYWKIK